MESVGVVEGFDVIEDFQFGLLAAAERAAMDLEFVFKFAPEAFDVGVFVAVVGAGEAGPDLEVKEE